MTTNIITTTVQDAVKQSNKIRLANKNAWIFLTIQVGNSIVQLKSYGTSIQRIQRNGIHHPGGWDMSATEWKKAIANALAYEG